MSTIRWVDLLSSESNFSHSKTNNDDVNEKLKKKKVFFKSEADLNNSFLNSYNGDLDNSNVGINLKIKNMCIKEKKDIKADEKINEKICSNKKDTIIQKNVNTNYDEKINVVHNIPYNDKDKKEKEEGLLNKIDNFDDNTNDQSKLYINNVQVSETQKNISPLDEKENNNNNNNKIVEKKTSKQTDDNKTNQDDVKVKVKINSAYPEQNNNDDLENEKDNKNKERVINNIPTHKEEQNNDISVISSNEESNPNNNNSNYILRNDKDTCNNTEDMSNRNKEKTTTQNILKNPVSNKNKEENCQSRDSSKKRNSVSKSSKNIIHPVDDNKKNVESLINPSETKKNDCLKMNQEKNIKYMEHSKKGKNKRKERNNNMENSMINNNSISVLDYTVSHDVTLDENNIPLNPTKKMKNKMKDLKHLEDDKNDDILNMNKSKIPNSFKQADSNNIVIKKLMKEENNSSVKENETINFLKIQNMNTMIDKEDNPFYNVMNNNIDLEKFKNFNNNFINYIGDIRNNFSESLCTANRNRVNSRLKEIAVGKSTKEYKNYVKLVKYQDRLEDDPATPNAYEDITNAKFQAKYNLWRKKLHKFDTLN
ncbi:conserved Plasmodium protein, unknown function [Plasmodium reichenowi]|uniref:Histone RNA hairpin-binding protein RNA-binding domain-containing protein n=1 Tax=Plasmodium reichenowi TaxID=5854 RepID=A0A2P9DDA0_PLARE|nr:conserved Plasmodium protein, unknown function [Plasmodium reichenowi]